MSGGKKNWKKGRTTYRCCLWDYYRSMKLIKWFKEDLEEKQLSSDEYRILTKTTRRLMSDKPTKL